MAKGGRREGAGRKPGSQAVKTIAAARANLEMVQSSTTKWLPDIPEELQNITPMEIMFRASLQALMAGDMDAAHRYSRDLAPYVHGRLSNITVRTEEDAKAVELSMEEIDARLARLNIIEAELIQSSTEADGDSTTS